MKKTGIILLIVLLGISTKVEAQVHLRFGTPGIHYSDSSSFGDFKVVSFFAKKARGAMSDYLVRHRIGEPEGLKEFNGLGYRFNQNLTSDDNWVFTRKEAA